MKRLNSPSRLASLALACLAFMLPALALAPFLGGTAEAGIFRQRTKTVIKTNTTASYQARAYAAPGSCASGQCARVVAPIYAAPVYAVPLAPVYSPARVAPVYAAPVNSPPLSLIGTEATFLAWLNSTRATYHLAPVGWDANLANQAAVNSAQQTRRGLGHFYMGNAKRQNSAMGSPGSLGSMWMNSPAHRSALLDPSIRVIGLAGSGAYWTFNAS